MPKFYPRRWTRCQIASGVIITAIGIFLVCFVPPFLKKMIYAQLTNDGPTSEAYSSFLERPTSEGVVYNSYYVYNVTNPDEVTNQGAKPVLVEFGPYTYRQIITHRSDDLAWRANGTLEYVEHCQYVFEPSRSKGSEADIFTTINMGYVGALNQVRNDPITYLVVEGVIALEKTPLFLNLNVSQILWGYNNTLLESLHALDKTINPFIALQVKDDNAETILPAAIWTGGKAGENYPQPPRNNIGQMTMWKGMHSTLNFWNSTYANTISGTDGTSFHPYFDEDEEPACFVDSLYRSVILSNCGTERVSGIKVYCLHLRDDMLASETVVPSNAGFFMKDGGFIPLPPALGQPVYVSLPHFHRGNWSNPLANKIVFVPDDHEDSKYDTRLYVEPFTGQLFDAHKRLQVNTLLEPGITAPKNATHTYFPIVWIDQYPVVADGTISKFKTFIYLPFYGSIVVGSVAIFAGLFLTIWATVRCTCWKSDKYTEGLDHEYSALGGDRQSMRTAPAANSLLN